MAGIRGQPRETDAADPRVAAQPLGQDWPPRPANARPAGPGCAARAAPAMPRRARRCRRGWCGGAAAWRADPASDVTRAPSTTSECPERYFVTECRTTSEPRARGCCTSGVEKVLSVTTTAPAACAAAVSARMSATPSIGLVGLSSQSMLAGLPAGRGELCQDGVGVRDVHRPQFQEALLRQFRGHHQRTRVAVGRHHQHSPGRDQGQRRAHGGEARGVQQARQFRAFQLAQRLLEGVPGGVGIPAVAAVAVAQRSGAEIGRGQHQRRVDRLVAVRAAGGPPPRPRFRRRARRPVLRKDSWSQGTSGAPQGTQGVTPRTIATACR